MPTANTKVLSARIDKGKYYSLLERAAARKMPLNAYINVLFDEILSLKKEVVQKAEKGATIETTKKTNCIAFQDFPNIIIQKIGGHKWSMHTIRPDNKVSPGTFGRQIANGSIVFDGYDISFGNDSKFHCKGQILKFYETELEIQWYD